MRSMTFFQQPPLELLSPWNTLDTDRAFAARDGLIGLIEELTEEYCQPAQSYQELDMLLPISTTTSLAQMRCYSLLVRRSIETPRNSTMVISRPRRQGGTIMSRYLIDASQAIRTDSSSEPDSDLGPDGEGQYLPIDKGTVMPQEIVSLRGLLDSREVVFATSRVDPVA